jgi:hypothetical protein
MNITLIICSTQNYKILYSPFLVFLYSTTHMNIIAGSLRLLQHVDSIQVPTEWQSAHSKTWKDISWAKKQFQVVNLYCCCIFIFIFFNFSIWITAGWTWDDHYVNPGKFIIFTSWLGWKILNWAGGGWGEGLKKNTYLLLCI